MFPTRFSYEITSRCKTLHVLESLIRCFYEFTSRTKSQYAVGFLPTAPLITRLIFTLFLIKKMYSPSEATKTEQLFRKINIGRVVAPHRKFNSWQHICSKTDKSIKQSPELQHTHSKHPRKTGLSCTISSSLCSSPTSPAIEKHRLSKKIKFGGHYILTKEIKAAL